MQFSHFYQSSEARMFWFNSLSGVVNKVQGSSERDSSYINQYVSVFVRVTKTRSMYLSPTSVWARLGAPYTALGCSPLVSPRHQSRWIRNWHPRRQILEEHLELIILLVWAQGSSEWPSTVQKHRALHTKQMRSLWIISDLCFPLPGLFLLPASSWPQHGSWIL